MTKVALAGDWHGQMGWQKAALHTLGRRGDVRTILHAGDYGLGWPGNDHTALLNSAESILKQYGMKLLITPGNHENWFWINSSEYDDDGFAWVREHVAHLRRNTLFELNTESASRKVLSLGGAPSIDYERRTEGASWWREEMLTYGDVIRTRQLGDENDIDIMVTHDAPDGATDRVQQIIDHPDFSMWSLQGLAYAAEGRALMNHAVSGVNPRVFVHGHFHAADMKQGDDTLWVSLGCDHQAQNLAVLDLETLEVEFIDQLDQDLIDQYVRRRRG